MLRRTQYIIHKVDTINARRDCFSDYRVLEIPSVTVGVGIYNITER